MSRSYPAHFAVNCPGHCELFNLICTWLFTSSTYPLTIRKNHTWPLKSPIFCPKDGSFVGIRGHAIAFIKQIENSLGQGYSPHCTLTASHRISAHMTHVRTNLFAILFCLSGQMTAQQIRYDRVDFQENPEWEQVMAEARRSGKTIFVDGYTTWCGPCKKMDKEIFTQARVANFFNQKFINVKYDMETAEGQILKVKYGVGVFPTYLFVTGNGEIVHRIVGAYLENDDFLEYAQMAVTPGRSYADLKARYENGERNSELMFDYFLALRLAGEANREKDIVEQYLKLMSKDHFMDPTYWDIVKAFLQDPTSREFKILIENRTEIGAAIGMAEVDEKIYAVLNGYFDNNQNIRPEDEKHIIDILRTTELARRNELLAQALAAQHLRNGEYNDYACLVDAMLDFHLINTHPDPLSEFDHHAALFEKLTVDDVLLRKALRWSEYTCEHETRPDKRSIFLTTKSKLLQKLEEIKGR